MEHEACIGDMKNAFKRLVGKSEMNKLVEQTKRKSDDTPD